MKSEYISFLAGKLWQTWTACWKAETILCQQKSVSSRQVFPVVTVWLWELDYKENFGPKNWCLWTVVLEKTLESPFGSKQIKPVNPNWNQPCMLVGRTDADVETPVFWSSNVNSWLTGKVPDAGKNWGRKEKRTSEDEMAGWHHWCNGHEFEETSGNGEVQRGLACCSPWGCKELDITGWLNKNNIKIKFLEASDKQNVLLAVWERILKNTLHMEKQR